jgi:flagellar basal body-associated protein FliL
MMSDIERAVHDVLNATEVTDLTTVEDIDTLKQELVEAINLVVGR